MQNTLKKGKQFGNHDKPRYKYLNKWPKFKENADDLVKFTKNFTISKGKISHLLGKMSEASISKIERIPVSFSRHNSMELICGRIKAPSFQIRIVFPFALFFLYCACLFPHAGVGGYRGGGGRGYFLRRGLWGCATRWDRFFPPGLTGNGVAVSIELLEFSVSGFTALEWKEGRFV